MSASVRGTDHERTGQPCQDACKVHLAGQTAQDELLAIVVCDGAGSAKHSDVGARTAADIAIQILSRPDVKPLDPQSGTELASQIIRRIQDAISIEAVQRGVSTREFACTLLVALVGPNWSFFAQLGDGAIVVSRPGEDGEYAWVFWPEKGEYANQTSFVTDSTAEANVMVDSGPGSIDEIAVFSDGLERLALDFSLQVPFRRFFEPLFSPLRDGVQDKSHLESLSSELGLFLSSPRINERTGDDKTLVVASRRHAE